MAGGGLAPVGAGAGKAADYANNKLTIYVVVVALLAGSGGLLFGYDIGELEASGWASPGLHCSALLPRPPARLPARYSTLPSPPHQPLPPSLYTPPMQASPAASPAWLPSRSSSSPPCTSARRSPPTTTTRTGGWGRPRSKLA